MYCFHPARGTEVSGAALALGISLRFCQIAPVNVPLLSRRFSGNFRPFRGGKHIYSDTSKRRLLDPVTFSHTVVNKSHQSTLRISFFASFFFLFNEQ